jgi:hypothetical protein
MAGLYKLGEEEEFATECANSAHALADHWLGYHPLEIACNEEQKKRTFPK